MGSGNSPPSFSYKAFTFMYSSWTIWPSDFDSPTGSIALFRHWAILALSEILPSLSTYVQAGSRKTSVLTFLGSIPGPFQKLVVSLSKRSIVTIQSSFESASRVWLALGLEHAGFIPKQMRPENFPLPISSNINIHEAFWPTSNFGNHW